MWILCPAGMGWCEVSLGGRRSTLISPSDGWRRCKCQPYRTGGKVPIPTVPPQSFGVGPNGPPPRQPNVGWNLSIADVIEEDQCLGTYKSIPMASPDEGILLDTRHAMNLWVAT
jgi:hypothetical protein